MNPTYQEHWEGSWKHCLRCRCAEWRLRPDEEKNKPPGTVPYAQMIDGSDADPERTRVVFLLSTPDAVQEAAGCAVPVWEHNGEVLTSPQIEVIEGLLLDMVGQQHLPFSLDCVAIVFAQACRPVNWTNTRRLVAPTGQLLGACRPRWWWEIGWLQPDLVVALGHYAGAHTLGSDTTKAAWVKRIGEVLELELPAFSVPCYYAPDPSEAILRARAEEFEEAFTREPPARRAHEKIKHLTWHLYRSLWMAEALRSFQTTGGPPAAAEWRHMLAATSRGHESKISVAAAVESLEAYLVSIRDQEMSEADVRAAMLDASTAPTPRPSLLRGLRSLPRIVSVGVETEESDEEDDAEEGLDEEEDE